jgi:uncharacterized phosphosugar-binding protein
MSESKTRGIDQFLSAIQAMQTKVIETQREKLGQVAQAMVETIQRGQRIFLFGTGHSGLVLEEAFTRAGGLAATVPVFSSSLMLHENTDYAMRLERTSGIAQPLLAQYAPEAGELIFVISNSGVNQMPVEMVLEAKKLGLVVVTICAHEYAAMAPLSTVGKRLYEMGDFNIDNGGIPGDALVPLEGREWRVAPSSSVVVIFLWNCLITETAFRLLDMGEEPPVLISGNYVKTIDGARAHNMQMVARWGDGNPHLPLLYRRPPGE